MSIKTRLGALERRRAARTARTDHGLAIRVWIPDNGRDGPPRPVAEQLAAGAAVVIVGWHERHLMFSQEGDAVCGPPVVLSPGVDYPLTRCNYE